MHGPMNVKFPDFVLKDIKGRGTEISQPEMKRWIQRKKRCLHIYCDAKGCILVIYLFFRFRWIRQYSTNPDERGSVHVYSSEDNTSLLHQTRRISTLG